MTKIKKILLIIAAIAVLLVIIPIINAPKYKMVVNVKEGENVMGINPLTERLDFGDLSRNNGMTRYVSLKNGGKMNAYIAVVKLGEISDLVKVDRNFFTLKPGEEYKLAFEVNIPNSAQFRKYSGWAMVFIIPKFF